MVQVHPGPPIPSGKPKRTSEPPPVGSRTDRLCVGCGACPLASAILSMTRSSMSRNPAPQAGKPGASPGRVAIHATIFKNRSTSASIEVMQQTFNLLSTEHSRGGGPFLLRKPNRTSAPGLFRKQIVPRCGMGSISSGFRQFRAGLAEQ